MGEMSLRKSLVWKPEGDRDQLGDAGINGRVIN